MEASPAVVTAQELETRVWGEELPDSDSPARAHPRPARGGRQAVRQAADPDPSRHRLPHRRTPNASLSRMHYRRRLRSRIILSFLLLGFGLTALFAVATRGAARSAGRPADRRPAAAARSSNFVGSSSAPIPSRTRRSRSRAGSRHSRTAPTARKHAVRLARPRRAASTSSKESTTTAACATTSWRCADAGHWSFLRYDYTPGSADPAADAVRAGRRRCSCSPCLALADRLVVVVAGDEPGDRTGAAGLRDCRAARTRTAGAAFPRRRSRRAGRGAGRLRGAPDRAGQARPRIQRRRQPRTAHAAGGDPRRRRAAAGAIPNSPRRRASACSASSAPRCSAPT